MLTFGGQTSGGGVSNTQIVPGIFIQEGTIEAAKVAYNCKPVDWSKYIDDIAVRLKLNIGRDWLKDLYIGGNWKKSPSGSGQQVITDWGSNFRIRVLLKELGVEGEVDGGKIDQSYIDQLVGKSLLYLQYVSGTKQETGKLKYSDFPIIAGLQEGETREETEHRLLSTFQDSHRKGYVKNFKPELMSAISSTDMLTGTLPEDSDTEVPDSPF